MAILKWRPQALKDLGAIEAYLEEVSPDYAPFFMERILQHPEKLKKFPRMGRIVPEIGLDSIRELIYRNYRIMYVIGDSEETIEVLTVIHSARQFGGFEAEDDDNV